ERCASRGGPILSHRGRGRRCPAVPGDEFVVARKLARGMGNEVANVLQILDAVVRRHRLDEWVRAAWTDPLTPHHLQPAREVEQLVRCREDSGRFTKQPDLMG